MEQLQEGKRIEYQLAKWKHILMRINLGGDFVQIKFIGSENKTMTAIEDYIKDQGTIEAYKKFVECQVKKNEEELKKL